MNDTKIITYILRSTSSREFFSLKQYYSYDIFKPSNDKHNLTFQIFFFEISTKIKSKSDKKLVPSNYTMNFLYFVEQQLLQNAS